MTTFIYMNDRIKQKRPRKPVIKADNQHTGREAEANCFDVTVSGALVARVIYDPKRNPSQTHHVKAWVEVYAGAEVRPGDGT